MKKFMNIGINKLVSGLGLVLIAGAISFNFAQGSISVSNSSVKHDRLLVNAYSTRDAEFLSRAAEINMEEISLAQLAQKKSSIEEVKDLGKMLENVHSKSLKTLNVLAQIKMITVPKEETFDIQNAYFNLNSKSKAEFDKAYCDAIVNNHKHAITLFEKASKESDDADIRKWATDTLPILHTYLQHSLSCQEKLDKARG